MRITHFYNATSKSAQYMHYDFEHAHGSIYSRYNNPSQSKIRAWLNIVDEYNNNCGVHHVMIKGVEQTLQYNNYVKIVGASSHFFSTISSFIDLDNNETYLMKETHCSTYACLYKGV